MVSVMNLLHGDPHNRAGAPLGHHPHISMLSNTGINTSNSGPTSNPGGPSQSAVSHQRSPFAIQELLGLGNSDNTTSSPTPASPRPHAGHPHLPAVSSSALVPTGGHPSHCSPYQHRPHQPTAAQCFSDPSRLYFGTAFMPNMAGTMHGMTAPPMPTMLGFDQGPQPHQARADTN
ncbi:hypothetical protein X975_11883, partial [Stegodyphus mimosarum]